MEIRNERDAGRKPFLKQRLEQIGHDITQQETGSCEEKCLAEITEENATGLLTQYAAHRHFLRTLARQSHGEIHIVETSRDEQDESHEQEHFDEGPVALLYHAIALMRFVEIYLVESRERRTPHRGSLAPITGIELGPIFHVLVQQLVGQRLGIRTWF